MMLSREIAHRRWRGFTLVELAVVLSVVAILLAMVLKSSSVTDSAKANDLISIAGDLSNAVRQYRSKYNYLPGDDPRAVLNVGATAGHNGNGNGSIDFDVNTGAEWDMAADDLYLAGLVRVSVDPANSLGLHSFTSSYGKVWLVSYAVAKTAGGGGSNASPCGVAVQSGTADPKAV